MQYDLYNISKLSVKRKTVVIRSEGCNDKGRAPGCGRAYIKLNGRDVSPHGRGYNFVVLTGSTGMACFFQFHFSF